MIPDKLLAHVNIVVDAPVNKLLSSPFNVAVIVKGKFAVGVEVLETNEIVYT